MGEKGEMLRAGGGSRSSTVAPRYFADIEVGLGMPFVSGVVLVILMRKQQ